MDLGLQVDGPSPAPDVVQDEGRDQSQDSGADLTLPREAGSVDRTEAPVVPTVRTDILFPEHLRKTMTLLTGAPAATRTEVRVLAFGQSISDKNARWWPMLGERLTARHTDARITIDTRGVGGCSARCLLGEVDPPSGPRTDFVARAVAWKPDLVIFHVYGNEGSYEQIVRRLREAGIEVLIQSDHVTWRPGDPEAAGHSKAEYDDNARHNTVWLPELCRRHGCAVAPVWQKWGAHLSSNRLTPRALLSDAVHPNDRGWRLIADVLDSALVAAQAP